MGGIFGLVLGMSFAQAEEMNVNMDVELVSIERITDKSRAIYKLEMAQTSEERRVGLMNRRHLDADKGMLFDYNFPYTARMWMKNTLISLDMIFVRADGRIAYIHHRAIPGDLSEITAGEPVRAVIELRGGQAKRDKISVGDRVLHKIFKTAP